MIARFIFGVVVVLLSLAASIFVLGWFGIDRSLPQYSGTEHLSHATNPIEIYRDSFAVVHIYGQTEQEAYYALGFAQAQERLFQMDMTRRIGQGRLSELIGEKGLVIDRWARTIGFSKIAVWMWNVASPQTKKFLSAYADGINDYIATHHGRLGMEFDGLHYEPNAWKPTDCMIIGRLMSWEMNFGFWNDAAFSDIADRVDSAHLASLMPGYPANAPTVLGDQHTASAQPLHRPDSVHAGGATSEAVHRALHSFFAELHDTPFGGSQAGGGSNTIALSARKSASGKPMLENDMHLALGAPSRWFVAHLHTNDGLNIAGFTVPGLPLVLSGRNEKISWGLTNGMIDESDYFILDLDSNGHAYHTPNGSKPITSSKEFIRVRTSDEEMPYRFDTLEVRTTDLGPIVSDIPTFVLGKTFANSPNTPVSDALSRDREPGTAIAVEWNGYFALGDELGSFFKLHRAKTCGEAIDDMSEFATPCLNLSVAGAGESQIAFQVIGRIPVRNGGEGRTLLPRHAEEASELWQGFVTTAHLPHQSDPADGFIVSANNPATAFRSNPHGENWEPPERAERMTQLVSAAKKLDPAQLSLIVRDLASPFEFHELRDPILRVYQDTSIGGTHLNLVTRKALDYLTNWDGVQDSMDVSTTILNVFLVRLLSNTCWDELGDQLYNEFVYVNNVPARTIAHLLTEPNNVWWDDVRSPQIETRDDMIRRSFEQTVKWLTSKFGPDVRRWTWGTFHTLTYHNPAGAASSVVANLSDIKSGPNGGSLTTVAQSSYMFWQPFEMRVGPSMRMIADMSKPSLFVSLPTGNSGNMFSPHYRDMVDQFKQGRFVELPLNRIEPTWQKLVLMK